MQILFVYFAQKANFDDFVCVFRKKIVPLRLNLKYYAQKTKRKYNQHP